MDWLQLIIQGGALALLAVVLWGVWRYINTHTDKLMVMLEASIEYIRESTVVQQRLCDNLERHEARATERHGELMDALRAHNGKK